MWISGGYVATSLSRLTIPNHGAIPISAYPAQKMGRSGNGGACSSVTAQSVEFVAKPEEALKAQTAIAPAITGALQGVTGFAGCIVMVSDHEARLITVVTFWRGSDRAKLCNANTRWVNALLAPYIDRKLRVQTMVAQLPGVAFMEEDTLHGREHLSTETLASQQAEVCVA
jgi:hypothetical protein